jgi:hypothetical protein
LPLFSLELCFCTQNKKHDQEQALEFLIWGFLKPSPLSHASPNETQLADVCNFRHLLAVCFPFVDGAMAWKLGVLGAFWDWGKRRRRRKTLKA